ncbi:MAG TPA: hypothetical protein V6C81_00660 [Planktothrix sp.]|jgi:hypothetical protein
MFGKGKDSVRGKSRPRPSQRADDGFDASPENTDLSLVQDNGNGQKPKNIMETKAWKESAGGARRFWHNYLNTLSTAFNRMSRPEQEQLITRISQIVAIGTAVITMNAWYWFLPQQVRVVALPAIVVASWFVGTKVMAPAMIARFEKHMKPPEE